MLAHQIFASIDKDSQDAIRVDKAKYEWYDDVSGECIYNGMMVLHLALQCVRPSVRLNVFNEIQRIKKILPKDHGYDIAKWCISMEKARTLIELKLPRAYHDDQFIMDIFDGALTAKVKTFVTEVSSMKLRWARGNSHGWTRKDIVYEISSLYTNIHSDGSWARELDETD